MRLQDLLSLPLNSLPARIIAEVQLLRALDDRMCEVVQGIERPAYQSLLGKASDRNAFDSIP